MIQQTLSALVLASVMTLPVLANAAEIKSATLDASGENIVLEVVHGGGCGDHQYSLQMQGCAESYPVQCRAKLIHTTNDFCEGLLHRSVVLNLKEAGIEGSYYSNGSLSISGSNGTKGLVYLPQMGTVPVLPSLPATTGSGTDCTTHTGSKLHIRPESKFVTLTTTAGKTERYGIDETDVLFLESFPGITQSTYKLDDGRSIVTSFREGSTTGTGHFVRLAGDSSPNFTCEYVN